MNYGTFCDLVEESEQPVVLVEGTRNLPSSDVDVLVNFAARLASLYPHMLFRTGNAKGADEAFAKGVKAVDPSRLQYVLPYARHRQKEIDATSLQVAFTDMPDAVEDRIARYTAQSSPHYGDLVANRHAGPQREAKARYLLRDTMKVVGVAEIALHPATAAIFYVNPEDPMKGGTGHTIRVCQKQKVPVAFQDEWMHWSIIQTKNGQPTD